MLLDNIEINLSEVVTDLTGKPLRIGNATEPTYRVLAANALLQAYEGEFTPYETKMQRVDLVHRLLGSGEEGAPVVLSFAEVLLIQALVSANYPVPLVTFKFSKLFEKAIYKTVRDQVRQEQPHPQPTSTDTKDTKAADEVAKTLVVSLDGEDASDKTASTPVSSIPNTPA